MKTTYLKHSIFSLLLIMVFNSCKETKTASEPPNQGEGGTRYAQGFTITQHDSFSVVTVTDPWPNSKKSFTYAFLPQDGANDISIDSTKYDAVITTPVKNLVVTSTTHIPALESLDGLKRLIGFPDTKYISSMPARQLIARGSIKELGNNESLNTEMVLDMRPATIIGFAIDNQNGAYDLLEKAGIPVLYNGDWTEQTPLGKAEWIKFFGILLDKEQQADSIFNEIATAYRDVKALAKNAKSRPSVISGALYKDVWYAPAGDSWAAQFLADASAQYIWSKTEGTGSLSLSLEHVISEGKSADFWISPAQFTAYQDMIDANAHYTGFEAFKAKQVFSFAKTVGPTGGMLYYELAPQRPDLVLKDLVHIFHPTLLPNHQPYFFQSLE